MTEAVRRSMDSEAAGRVLKGAATLFTLVVLFHNADHVRRGGESVTTDVFWIGSAAIALEIGVVAIIFAEHRDAPVAAILAGFALALGYVAVHFTPDRAWLSDSFVSGSPALISRIAGSLEVAGALALAFAGLAAARAPVVAEARGRPLIAAFRHPVVALMTAGNLTIFALAVVDRYA